MNFLKDFLYSQLDDVFMRACHLFCFFRRALQHGCEITDCITPDVVP